MSLSVALVSEEAYRAVRREIERLREENHAQACAITVLLEENKRMAAEIERLRAEIKPEDKPQGEGDGVKTLRGFGIAFLLGGSMWAVAGGCVGRMAGWW